MILTEEILAPYRSDVLGSRICTVTQLPAKLFTSTDDAFHLEWVEQSAPSEELEIVLLLAFTKSFPILRPGREWLALEHPCGGIACQHQMMVATRLIPSSSSLPSLREIARAGYGADHFYPPLLVSRIVDYVSALGQIGVDCESSYGYLAESLYPIDATQDNLNRLVVDAPDLRCVAEWPGFMGARYSNNPVIFAIARNSD